MKPTLFLLVAAAHATAVEVSPAIQELIAGGRFAEARRQCAEVTARDGSDVEHWVCMARMSAWLGDYAAAVGGYDAALSVSPNDTDALTGKALVLIWQRKFDPAQALLSQVQAIAPASAEVELALAQLERARGRRREAQRHARRALALNAAAADARTLLQALDESAPVVLRFGGTRDFYSFTTPGTLESMAVDYEGDKNKVSLTLENSTRFGEKTTRGGPAWRVRFTKRWSAYAEGLIGSGGEVYPYLDLKAGVAAQLDAHWVPGIECRTLTFSRESVQVVSPSIEYYWTKRPVWAQLSLHESWSEYRQQAAGGQDWSLSGQIGSQVSRRLLAHVGFASGDENYINWNAGQIGDVREKSVFGGVEYRVTSRYTAGFSYGFAARSNNLTQQTWGVNLIVRL
jgi:YaiO family outer membrane protein